jgi:hypothetical protein
MWNCVKLRIRLLYTKPTHAVTQWNFGISKIRTMIDDTEEISTVQFIVESGVMLDGQHIEFEIEFQMTVLISTSQVVFPGLFSFLVIYAQDLCAI